MADDDDDKDRHERERKAILDRMFRHPPCSIANGFVDDGGRGRTARPVQLTLRMDLQDRTLVAQILERDRLPSLAALFKLMLGAYLEKHGPIDPASLQGDG